MDPFEIVRDSSIWRHETDQRAITRKDPYLRLGIVKRVSRDSVTSEIKYLVEVRDQNDGIELNASMLRRFGGVFNYEDVVMQGYKISDLPDPTNDFQAKAGDTVLVAFMNGESREAVIIGGISHPGRTSVLPVANGPQYLSEFNGVETSINNNGEYTLTFKGVPTNIALLSNTPSAKIPAPTYDTSVGSTYMKFDKTGGWEISDNASGGPQNIHIDKAGKKIETNAGTWSVNATTAASIKSPTVAFGKEGIELLDELSQLIDALGQVTPISPVGSCTPLMSTPQWSQVTAIQSKIKEITGSLI